MKNIYSFILLSLLAFVSCNKISDETPGVREDGKGGRYVTQSFVIGDPFTRSTSSFTDEAKINDATIFVYQKNMSTGVMIDYDRKYVKTNTVSFDLYFSDQTEYQYSFAVWVNMGDLADEPTDGAVKFANEVKNDIQMRGTLNNLTEDNVGTISIPVVRYVGKVNIQEIKLNWKNTQNSLKTFKLLEVYVANAATDDSANPSVGYNSNGVRSASTMDGFIYDNMGSTTLTNTGTYTTDHIFYAYDHPSTEFVIKASLDGQVMYYHYPIEPADNTYKAYNVEIKQAGSTTPLGELPEESIVVSTITLSVQGWNNLGSKDVIFQK